MDNIGKIIINSYSTELKLATCRLCKRLVRAGVNALLAMDSISGDEENTNYSLVV